jgi:hypothetical protein
MRCAYLEQGKSEPKSSVNRCRFLHLTFTTMQKTRLCPRGVLNPTVRYNVPGRKNQVVMCEVRTHAGGDPSGAG